MYNLSNFFMDQGGDPNSALYQGKNPNSSLFDPTASTGQKTLVPPTAMASSLGANPGVTDTIQSLTQPAPATSPGAGMSGVGQGDTSSQALAGSTQLDPMAPPHPAPQGRGKDVDGNDLLKKYTSGSGGGGLLKLVAAFL